MSDWISIAFFAVLVILLVSSLVTGKTMTPLRGTQPFIVTRREHPKRYWGGIAVYGLFALFLLSFIIP